MTRVSLKFSEEFQSYRRKPLLPLLLKESKAVVAFTAEEVDQPTVKIQNVEARFWSLEAKAGAGSAILSMANEAARFVEWRWGHLRVLFHAVRSDTIIHSLHLESSSAEL
ncbi:hypothetical protein V6N13_070564 [Hibiscus sabdariffa]|uniref:Uncharacterized protein n=1 Tax=Hibiscus sabdariffa TaxID=183260 RepID=A0ABR2TG04_9ROSI